ncbi:hypothetical protein D3C87_1615950 [compost metagenome]
MLPAGFGQDDIALAPVGMARGFHARDGAAHDHLADAYGWRVGLGVADAPAHVGIQRQVLGFQQQLANARLRDGRMLETKVAGFGAAYGAGRQDDAQVLGFRHGEYLRGLSQPISDNPDPRHPKEIKVD